jgi:hypothetical protein
VSSIGITPSFFKGWHFFFFSFIGTAARIIMLFTSYGFKPLLTKIWE